MPILEAGNIATYAKITLGYVQLLQIGWMTQDIKIGLALAENKPGNIQMYSRCKKVLNVLVTLGILSTVVCFGISHVFLFKI